MKFVNIDEKNIIEYEEFNKKYGNIYQSLNWLKSNNILNYEAIIGYNNNEIYISGVFIYTKDREVNEISIYFPRGPVYKKYDEEVITEFIKYIEKYAICKNIKYVKYESNGECEKCIEYEN